MVHPITGGFSMDSSSKGTSLGHLWRMQMELILFDAERESVRTGAAVTGAFGGVVFAADGARGGR